MKKIIFALLMAGLIVTTAKAQQIWATIIDQNTSRSDFHHFFIDIDGDGIEDGLIRINQNFRTAPFHGRHLRVGSKVLFDASSRNPATPDNLIDLNSIRSTDLIKIITPDGRTIWVADYAPRVNYQRAHNFRDLYEARQAGRQ